ncbi:response regulator transcription factor [Piscinibacter gummiphilus]|uniref:Response regulator transcription factor n=1 Tax=Piscinibacter gummiphilus TaxID=946333 RepID=A0ABZ0CVC6_9BURK|nr:response regulator transcription factor [Piscinibacter gummiphilus]WOB08919.1 response regulator transcription factor [Piscinibacter gummiphilus]
MRVLLAEDDPVLGQALRVGLSREGLDVAWTRDGIDTYTAFRQGDYAALVLDLDLPGLPGLDVLHRIRQTDWRVPVIIVTALSDVPHRVRGLDLGADDYLGKPFDLDELLARLRAVTRRSHGVPGAVLACRGVEIDLRDHRATRDGLPLWLTGREFTVLRLLMESAGKPVPRQRIEEQLGAWGGEVEGNSAEVYIHKLRKKLGRDFIQTLHGNGYLLPL